MPSEIKKKEVLLSMYFTQISKEKRILFGKHFVFGIPSKYTYPKEKLFEDQFN